ncbi:MAG: FAD-binding protein, partial [Oscillospiraceae bacterium]|nr:FAD-binding protein [Oscillospiraceae bacterium]
MKELSRRDFLRGALAGTAAVALTSVTGVSALAEEKGIYTPGTYSATAKGIASDVKVTMTFDANSITDVTIDVSGETPDIGGAIGGQMQDAILAAQSVDVDAVSGASVTSDAIRQAAAACVEQASGQAVTLTEKTEAVSDWLGEAPEIPESEITEELETEVLVVGCGTGGWIATMTAAEEGAKVLVVEKRETATNIREDIGGINSRLQLESFKDFPEFEIDKTEALQEIVRYASGYVDSNLVKTWIDNSGELVDWLTDLMESTGDWTMSLEGGIGDQDHPERDKAYATGHSPHKTEQGNEKNVSTSSTFRDFCDSTGNVDWRFSTALVKLDVDAAAGKVTGIIAQDLTDNHYIRVKASKGVIMATGGYATNTDMMLALQPMTMEMKANVPIGSTCDGSGIKAMLWAGGQMDPCHASMMFNRCSVLPTETAGYKTNGKWFWFG